MRFSKKRYFLFAAVLALILVVFGVVKYGVQFGSVRLGKQADLLATQRYDIENSNFYTNYYDTDSLIVLNFWATWCKPCIAEMPELNKLKQKYEDEKVVFVSFSMDSDSLKLVDFLKQHKLDFKDLTIENMHYRTAILNTLRGKNANAWIGSYSLPMTFVIKDKNVIAEINGVVENSSLIELIESNK